MILDLSRLFPDSWWEKKKKTEFTVPPLLTGDSYTGPTGPGDAADLCKCNTVVYSLMSACDACQGGKWFPCVPFLPLSRPSLGILTVYS